jgi:hypothetical protein
MVWTLEEVELFTFFGEGGRVMPVKSSDGNWFLIMCSWEMGEDAEAVQRFHAVYEYFTPLTPTDNPEGRQEALALLAKDDPRLSLVPDSLKSLNLIGRRKFVIICQIISENSNRVLQALSRKISLGAPISVEIFPATYVHDLTNILPERRAVSE